MHTMTIMHRVPQESSRIYSRHGSTSKQLPREIHFLSQNGYGAIRIVIYRNSLKIKTLKTPLKGVEAQLIFLYFGDFYRFLEISVGRPVGRKSRSKH